jgi:hypothetical protein
VIAVVIATVSQQTNTSAQHSTSKRCGHSLKLMHFLHVIRRISPLASEAAALCRLFRMQSKQYKKRLIY